MHAIHEIQQSEVALREIILRSTSHEEINAELRALCGVANFFPSQRDVEEARGFILIARAAASESGRQWGDFQTPPALARRVCTFLQSNGVVPSVVVEPTYGLGNFLWAASETFESARFYGVEVQPRYQWHFKMRLLEEALQTGLVRGQFELVQDDIFVHQFPPALGEDGEILLLGNPPWVTNAELGGLDSCNLPRKGNLKSLSGLDAMTGKSNFDLGEAVLLRLLDRFASKRGVLALLCKNSVIKNWVERLPKSPYRVYDVQALEIDAPREFGASVSASLLFARFGAPEKSLTCRVGSIYKPQESAKRVFGWHDDKFVADLALYQQGRAFDGVCPLVWRQGLKHDCAPVMELRVEDGRFVNGLGEEVDVEPEWVFPLWKSSDLKGNVAASARRFVIVPQKRLGEDTDCLRHHAPRLWAYLQAHRGALQARKSSIYRGKPAFSVFGLGPYSFACWKVAVSGLYKTPRFSVLQARDGQPPMVDDTAYLLPFERRDEALLVAFLLQSAPARILVESLAFADAKRPFTKDVLMRLDLNALRLAATAQEFERFWGERGQIVDASALNEPLIDVLNRGKSAQLSLL